MHDISLGHGVFVVFTGGVDVGVSEKLLGCGLVIDEICVVVVSSTIRDVSDTVADVVFDSDVACVVSGVQNEDEAGSCLVDGTLLFPRVVSLPSNVLLKTELKVIVGKYVFAKLDLFTLLTFTLFELCKIVVLYPDIISIRPSTSTTNNILMFMSTFCVKAIEEGGICQGIYSATMADAVMLKGY